MVHVVWMRVTKDGERRKVLVTLKEDVAHAYAQKLMDRIGGEWRTPWLGEAHWRNKTGGMVSVDSDYLDTPLSEYGTADISGELPPL